MVPLTSIFGCIGAVQKTMMAKIRIPFALSLLVGALQCWNSQGFVPLQRQMVSFPPVSKTTSSLGMGLDVVTYLRTEWVSAALVTNQTPRSADVCLQLGTQDGRAVTFIPRTIRELITSSVEADGILSISTRRQLKQQQERRTGSAKITYVDQRADDLKETADNSVDVVISLQAAAKMEENGLDWKKSINEAARVLKPGGRFLFVEQTAIEGESYLEYMATVKPPREEGEEGEDERFPVFELVGYDDVDLVLVPHVAGVVVKSEDAGLSPDDIARKESRAEKDRIADLSIAAYERGMKKRKRKKKSKAQNED
jgi:SAM-dependent methyltransferase